MTGYAINQEGATFETAANLAFPEVYVYYPRGFQTGGPEALHQLVSALRGLGVDAYLVPSKQTAKRTDVPDYASYNCPIVMEVPDRVGVLVVAPESAISVLGRFRLATTMIWWLSVDNSQIHYAAKRRERGQRKDRAYWGRFRRTLISEHGRVFPWQFRNIMARALHATQSSYAWSELYANGGTCSSMLTDYTLLEEFGSSQATPADLRGRSVAYNPAKGGAYVEAMRSLSPDLVWRPIIAMTRREVVETLNNCAIYLDLGNHPGKDRIPREAALCGAVVVVGRRGSGAFHADTPIPWECKVSMSGDVRRVAGEGAQTLDSVFAKLSEVQKAQASYAHWIRGEKDRFVREVEAIFVEGKLGFDVTGFE